MLPVMLCKLLVLHKLCDSYLLLSVLPSLGVLTQYFYKSLVEAPLTVILSASSR